jgi:hypothetical protein
MTDIVERLATARNMIELERAASNAIDEIERLRDEAALRIPYKEMARGLEDRLREQANEIERLRGLLLKASGPMSYGRWSTDFRREVKEALGDV